ncbi:unnamed protein product [Brassica rapa]|uniref:Uncharacterized protein n=2 Tax=Brassica TaxID=3705 RepID=A0A8D9DDH3_BRACM|nr:unnamed protein product [Brassica napus]CAG7871343.1 unnamed protein product [Brassica rapa]
MQNFTPRKSRKKVLHVFFKECFTHYHTATTGLCKGHCGGILVHTFIE